MKPGSTIRNIILGVVYVFGFMMVLGALMGGGDDTTADAEPESDSNTDDLEQEQDSTDSSDDSSSDASSENSSDESSDTDSSDSSDSDDSSSSTSNTFSVRVQYSGEWSGAVGSDGSTRSVDGSGEETLEVEGDPMTISANAQKQDDSSDELTIQILQDGEVVSEQSTTAEYGVAQTTHSNF